MLKEWLWRILAAIGAALYWYVAAWLCFAVTGNDPLDALSGAGTLMGRLTVLVIMAAAVIGLALASRAMVRMRRG